MRRARARRWLAAKRALLLLCILTTGASAQSFDVTASLSLTDGAARAEAYVPITIKITNHLGGAINGVTVMSGGPVITSVPWSIAPDETSSKVVPVYYAGGDLRLTILPHGSFPSREPPAAVATPSVRPLGMDEAFVAAPPDLPPILRQMLLGDFSAKSLRVMNLSREAIVAAEQCGMLDAVAVPRERAAWPPTGRAVTFEADRPPAMDEMWLAFPAGTEAAVQPEAYRLFAIEPWPTNARWRLWLWLGVFTLAAAVAAALISRRRAAVAVAVLVGLAAGTGAFLWFEGDLRVAPVREARVFYTSFSQEAMCEDFVSWGARGEDSVTIPIAAAPDVPLPLPVMPSSESLLTPQMMLDLAPSTCVLPARKQLLIHTLMRVENQPFRAQVISFGPEDLAALAKRPGAIAAMLVRGDSATDAAGRSQSIDAWSAELAASADADTAYAGRSLRWWAKDRYDNRHHAILVWWLDPLPPEEVHANRLRLPALVVYKSPWGA